MDSWLSIKGIEELLATERLYLHGAIGDPLARAPHGGRLDLLNVILLEMGRVARGETVFRPSEKIFAEKKSEIEETGIEKAEKFIAKIEKETKLRRVKRLAAGLRIVLENEKYTVGIENEPKSARVRNLEKALEKAIRRHDRFGGEENRQEILNLGRTLNKVIEDEKKSAGIEKPEKSEMVRNLEKAIEETTERHDKFGGKADRERLINLRRALFNVIEDEKLEAEIKRGEEKGDLKISPGGEIETVEAEIEKADGVLARLVDEFDVVMVTGDHSTPSSMRAHSWHPVPLLIASENCRANGSEGFGERACAQGALGRVRADEIMPLVLAHAGRLRKFGA